MQIPGKQIYHAYFEEQNLVFTLIPKNANTSIKYALIKTFIDTDYDITKSVNADSLHASTLSLFTFIDNAKLHNMNNNPVKRCLRISVVRNPFDRLVSGWNDKVRKLNRRRFGFNQACSFHMFIKQICSMSDEKINRHFIPQYNFIINTDGELITDKILKFEKLFEDWEELQKLILMRNDISLHDLPKKKLNSTSNLNNKFYQQYYTRETQRLVENKFEKDLNLFNYEF